MDDQQLIDFLTAESNRRIDLFGDFCSEETEELLFRPIISLVVPYIPTFMRPILIDAGDGLDDNEIKEHAKTLTTYIQERLKGDIVKVPWYARALVENAVNVFSAHLIEIILEYAQKGSYIGIPEGSE